MMGEIIVDGGYCMVEGCRLCMNCYEELVELLYLVLLMVLLMRKHLEQ